MEKVKFVWHMLVANPLVVRLVRYAVLLLLGAAIEQVARLGVLPPEVVLALQTALSVS